MPARRARPRAEPAGTARRSGRDVPAPPSRWTIRQRWSELLFAHWPVAPDALRARLPHGVVPDLYDGSAWVGVIPFRIPLFRVRFLPAVPGLDGFDELNVRTYVRAANGPGVYFFSLDATSALAVRAARALYGLNYHRADITFERTGDRIRFRSVRRNGDAVLDVRYRATSDPYRPEPGTLDRWLVDRWRLYTADRRGGLLRAEIDHPPWQLRRAEADFRENTMAAASGLSLPASPPVLHFADGSGDVLTWPAARVPAS